ncbi:hypothetical protein ACI2K4_22295 [Micromonospora sp. NPDC050397]|uniref:deazapurine DNA modification protein DpdA family protein n=1 Tax=Micromonospora sp. NPDC050397 TaxID=3364279 RepID=UPI00384F6F63
MRTFYLGTHRPAWLRGSTVALFVSDTTLRRYRALPRASTTWALDSGAYSQLWRRGGWQDGPTPRQYAARIRRYADEIGHLAWASPQDHMCEPDMLHRTGLTVERHIDLTVGNYLELKSVDPGSPVIPVVQGWLPRDYARCVALYSRHGVDLTREPLVGVGSVCRRQGTTEAEQVIDTLRDLGVRRLHTYGVKTLGLRRFASRIDSSDSMAWSLAARYSPPLPDCSHRGHCGNCRRWAMRWRQGLLRSLPAARP